MCSTASSLPQKYLKPRGVIGGGKCLGPVAQDKPVTSKQNKQRRMKMIKNLSDPVADRDKNPRTGSRLARWFSLLALAIALARGAASAQADGTVTISGTFSMDYLYGELDLSLFEPDLL